ncbi:uncharacterized protein LOC101856477 [Aplysia californica]|uniref:Uncharacterized protein LOC101856477 n=1 Tax=Aplysia californica TaxID=6500 RepID=A0ABM1W2S3_APLCA|nr:uncharacterized protein LOC101856477 [Aplysia californica]
MATVATDAALGRGGNPHAALLEVPPRLPFPTSPSVPDRRARLKRLNLNLASRDSSDTERPLEHERRKRVSRDSEARPDSYRDNNNDDDDSTNRLRGLENGSYRETSVGRYKEDDGGGGGGGGYISSPGHDSSRQGQVVRRSRRNIVTSRSHGKTGDSVSLSSRNRRARSRLKDETDKDQLRLPDIKSKQRLGSPQGVFLTALSGYDDTPLPSERRPSVTSRSSREAVPPAAASGDADPSLTSRDNKDGSPTRLPVLSSSRDGGSPSKLVVSRNTVGLQRVYLEGLDYMRGHVTNVEEDVEKINREFHRVQTASGGDFLYYLKECDERLLQANTDLRKRDIKLEVIDSDTRMVRLLNELRRDKQPDKALVEFITHFWHEMKSTTESLQALLDKFNNTVLLRLSNNYIGSHSADLQVPVCQQYALDIEGFLKDLDTQLGNARLMVKSYGNGIHQNLLDDSDFSQRLMVCCDLKAFPILGFIHDVCGKILKMCASAREWLARDEQFMHEINSFIRETRTVARRREQALMSEKQKRKKQEKNVKIAQSILHNNRQKLRLIEQELQQLETRLNESKVEQKVKSEEIQQKESMVDFLKLTLQQTKKNYSLQTKRTKLLRQVRELEDYLRTMEANLEVVQDKILAKSHEKILLAEKINHSEKSYDALKTDFDKYSDNLEELEAEVTGLSGQLLQLEIVHTIKTSPETLDNLLDRPSTVKLSQSLKERIKERKKKAAAKAS